jgi:nucleoside 2-deoxyribosyltransferase
MQLTCFVIMPFRTDFDLVFNTVREAAAEAVPEDEMVCSWLKDVHAAGRITDDIHNSIRSASICVSELTGNNPNVMWETGYAMALGKPTILIAQDIGDLPFDLKVHRVVPYLPNELQDLKRRLVKAIQETMSAYALKTNTAAAQVAVPVERRTIAVTGTMSAVPAMLQRRVPATLEPYLSDHTRWLTGSSGIVDEMVLEYLLARGQKAAAVGYNRYDFSETVRQMSADGRIDFIDASVEPVPKALGGPSRRDSFFCAKADLVVLFWDSASRGTGELKDYFLNNNITLLVGFV